MVNFHQQLTKQFILNFQNNQVTLVGVTFTISSAIISQATGIPIVGEKWFKQKNLHHSFYEPYLKTRFKNDKKRIFPFSYPLDKYVPLMKIIMSYFTCEGRFSRLYSNHIRLPMHFTRVRMLNFPYYLFKSIDKMTYIAQKRDLAHQMHSIFHHSLIKMIVLHHLDQLGITWEAFIANEIFNEPPTQPTPCIPPSSSTHPSTSSYPPQPTYHSSSTGHSSPDISTPSTSPFHVAIHSLTRDDDSDEGHDEHDDSEGHDVHTEHGQSSIPQRNSLQPFDFTYQRGKRQLFTLQKVGGALPSSSALQVKGKEKMVEEAKVKQQHEEHDIEKEFILVDSSDEEGNKSSQATLSAKDAKITELEVNLQRAQYVISFYEQENKQLEVKQEFMQIKYIKEKMEVEKAKFQLDEPYGDYGEPDDEQGQRKRSRTRGLRKALDIERQKEVELEEQLTLNEQLVKDIAKNRESWLEKVNTHLETLLEKANKDVELQRKIAEYYARSKLKRSRLMTLFVK